MTVVEGLILGASGILVDGGLQGLRVFYVEVML